MVKKLIKGDGKYLRKPTMTGIGGSGSATVGQTWRPAQPGGCQGSADTTKSGGERLELGA